MTINKVSVQVDKIRSYQTLVYKTGKRSFRTKEYNDYIQMISLQLGKLKAVKGHYSLKLTFITPVKTIGDIDNITKPISDILELSGKVENDRYCVHLEAEKILDRKAKPTIIIQTQERRLNE